MKRLDELFEVRNGIAASRVTLTDEPADSTDVALMRPSKFLDSTVAGWVQLDAVGALQGVQASPPGAIFVSTNGEGSHTYAHVAQSWFVPNSDGVALLPKSAMTEMEIHFYAMAITRNRPKFSYARKPKGNRLASIMLPELHELPDWLKTIDTDAVRGGVMSYTPPVATGKLDACTWRSFKYTELFEITRGQGPTLAEAKDHPGSTPYVTASAKNNGASAFTAAEAKHPGGCLSVAIDGSVGECFYQHDAFVANTAVVALVPLKAMARDALLFIATLIRLEGKLKYGYCRKWGLEPIHRT